MTGPSADTDSLPGRLAVVTAHRPASKPRTTGPNAPEPAPATPDSLPRNLFAGLSLPQIAGAALSAVTAAFAASRLGVAGTLGGAALGSVVSSLGTALYVGSIQHAGKKLRVTEVITVADAGVTRHTVASAKNGGGPGTATAASLPLRPARKRSPRWRRVVVLAVLAFVVAVAGITVTELVLGHPVSGGDSSGTSIGSVVGAGSGQDSTGTGAPASSGGSATDATQATGTATVTETATATATATETVTPTATVTPTTSATSQVPSTTDPGTITATETTATAPVTETVAP